MGSAHLPDASSPCCSAVLPSVAGENYSPTLNESLPTKPWSTLKPLLSKAPLRRSTPVTREAVHVETICRLHCRFLGPSRYFRNHYPRWDGGPSLWGVSRTTRVCFMFAAGLCFVLDYTKPPDLVIFPVIFLWCREKTNQIEVLRYMDYCISERILIKI